MDKTTAGREPIEIVEIDQDYCALSYGQTNGQGTCNAVLSVDKNKCFNTLGTCGSTSDYSPSILTLRFCSDQKNIPEDFYYYPFLTGAKIKPAILNPGSANKSSSALGKRATISASFSDHPSTDRYVDKYLSDRKSGAGQEDGIGYNPFERSTFWRKWRARNLFYLYRPIRYISGYINEEAEIVDAITQNFVITKVAGPDNNGKVSIEGKDILTLAQTDKAEAPYANTGKLASAITDSANTLNLSPTGIGDIEYEASGFVRIGEEICSFTRATDVLTISRAQYNTTASVHDAGDTVQQCLEFSGKLPYEILYTLLNEYSNIAAEYLDTSQWIEESVTNAYLPLAYSALISEPTPVQELLAEMLEQMYFYAWFNTRSNKVKIRAVRPIGLEDITPLDYSSNIIADSVQINDKPEQVISRVVINYGLFNPAKELDEISNYRVSDVFADLELEGENKNRSSSTKTIFSRWLTSGAGAAAEQLGLKLIARYSLPPEEISFSLDAKDRDLWTGDFAEIITPFNVNPIGIDEALKVQVISAEESKQGTAFSYVGQSFKFEEQPVTNEKLLRQSGNIQNLILRNWYDSQFPSTPPTSGDVITFELDQNVIVSSASTSLPALDSGSFPAGCIVNLILRGSNTYIVGKGGKGGKGASIHPGHGFNGYDGGTALNTTFPLNVTNNGVIGGGGGGGGGGHSEPMNPFWSAYVGGGGGGGGAGLGELGLKGGDVGNKPYWSAQIATTSKNGTAGTYINYGAYGVGGVASNAPYSAIRAGRGGNGGALGDSGENGKTRYSRSGGIGGAAGNAVEGDSLINWVQLGDVRGARIN